MNSNMDSYKVNERAWECLLRRVLALYGEGKSKSAIARLLGCNRSTVHRWIEDRKQSSSVSFKDMIHYLDRLRIPLADVFRDPDGDLPAPSPDRSVTELDRRIAQSLVAVCKAVGKEPEDIARDFESITTDDVSTMLRGLAPMRASDLYRICRAIGVSPETILNRAVGLADG